MTEEHGYNRYTYGCRCETCRSAKADYMRVRRTEARRLAQRYTETSDGKPGNPYNTFVPGASRHYVPDVPHGTRYAYDERGCRCLDCSQRHEQSHRTRWLRTHGDPA